MFQHFSTMRQQIGFQPTALRQLELAQRFYCAGLLDQAFEATKDLLALDPIDPVAGVLAGYLALKLGKGDELARIAERMVLEFQGLSDSHVLAAQSADTVSAAVDATWAALEQGIPIFSDGLARLHDSLEAYDIQQRHTDHPLVRRLVDLFESRISGQMVPAF
jgi:hypothetical protein